MIQYGNLILNSCRLLAVMVIATLALSCSPVPSDYASELESIRIKLHALDSAADDSETSSPDREFRRVYLLYSYASLTADYDDFKTTEQAINTAIEAYGELYDLLLFRARLNLKVHRLEAARQDLERLARISDNAEISAMLGDIALQEGNYPVSRETYETLVKEAPDWDKQARLAWYLGKTGQPDKADALYHSAQETLSYQQMRPYAWLELQRGILDLDQHRFEEALTHFQHANRAYSGYWLIEEHLAEAYQLTGDKQSARDIYRKIVANQQHPEYFVALAQLEQSDDPETADALLNKANALFEKRNKLYPRASKSHYVKFLLAQKAKDARLLEFARQNCADRPYAESQLLLARAYLKFDKLEAARNVMLEILKSPWRTHEILALAKQLNVHALNEFHASIN